MITTLFNIDFSTLALAGLFTVSFGGSAVVFCCLMMSKIQEDENDRLE